MSLIVFLPGFPSSDTLILPVFWKLPVMTRPRALTFSYVVFLGFKDTIVFSPFFFISVFFNYFFFPWRVVAKAVSTYSFWLTLPLTWVGYVGPVLGFGPKLQQPESPCDFNGFLYEQLLPISFFFFSRLILFRVKLSRLAAPGSRNKRPPKKRTRAKRATFERGNRGNPPSAHLAPPLAPSD